MRPLVTLAMAMMALGLTEGPGAKANPTPPAAPAAAPRPAGPAEGNDFVLHDSDSARSAHGAKATKIQPTKTEAAMKFFVVDKEKGPVKGVVVSLTSPAGTTYYTDETDADGYAEVLVPVGQKYDVTYLSLGSRKEIAATVSVTNEPRQNVKLTLRYKRQPPPPPFVLTGVNFDTAKATIRPESFVRLDLVVEFMKHRKSSRVEIAGHTDNAGTPKSNRVLSQKRAEACRTYLISKGIDDARIEAVGHGDTRPVAPNTTDEGRQKNRRIEVVELPPPAP